MIPVRTYYKQVLLLLLPGVALLAVIGLAGYRLDFDVSRLTRDPLAVTGSHPFIGFVSNLGAVFWSCATAVCLFSYIVLSDHRKRSDFRFFVLFGGLLSLLLLFDDLYMLHELFYRKYLGLNEKFVFLIYGVLILFYLVRFRKRILESEFLYLAMALALFALSIAVDRLPEDLLPVHHLFEDGPKFLGILSWFGYQLSVCRQAMSQALSHS
jgi:hypothetical protein